MKFLTQKELGELAGLSEETINRLETGKHKPTFASVKKLATALKVEPSDIKF